MFICMYKFIMTLCKNKLYLNEYVHIHLHMYAYTIVYVSRFGLIWFGCLMAHQPSCVI